MSKTEKLNEEQVFKQEIADDELETVAGGGENKGLCGAASYGKDTKYDCTGLHKRDIYKGGFPNCAATVEEGSWCKTNDACNARQVVYVGMSFFDCRKAWE